MVHYVDSIELFGTTDNYNTEYTERLHIDLTKDAYRATNHRNEYPQMTIWLERREKLLRHQNYLEWCLGGKVEPIVHQPSMAFSGTLTLTKYPSKRAVDLDEIITGYGAVFFQEALRRYIVLSNHSGPPLTSYQLERTITYMNLPFTSVHVYHKLKFTRPINTTHTEYLTLDAIYVRPRHKTKC